MKQSKTRFPLRKIEYPIRQMSGSGFMTQQEVHLECGHDVVVSTATTYRARCYKCRPTKAAPDAGRAEVTSGQVIPPAQVS